MLFSNTKNEYVHDIYEVVVNAIKRRNRYDLAKYAKLERVHYTMPIDRKWSLLTVNLKAGSYSTSAVSNPDKSYRVSV